MIEVAYLPKYVYIMAFCDKVFWEPLSLCSTILRRMNGVESD